MLLNKKVEFFISTISDNPETIFRNIKTLNRKIASGFHFDVMDGVFVPRLGLYPELLKAIKLKSDLPIEVHLMVTKPEQYFDLFASYGCTRIIIHYENLNKLENQIKYVKNIGLEVGVALNSDVPLESLDSVFHLLDVVMLMAIKPGIPKHPFIESTYKKLEELANLSTAHEFTFKISIDGGVTFDNIARLLENGADILICGSGTVFNKSQSFKKNLKLLRRYTS
jgi:ribulose-phosphate 3-epimerase